MKIKSVIKVVVNMTTGRIFQITAQIVAVKRVRAAINNGMRVAEERGRVDRQYPVR